MGGFVFEIHKKEESITKSKTIFRRAASNNVLLRNLMPAVFQPAARVISTDPPVGGEWRDLHLDGNESEPGALSIRSPDSCRDHLLEMTGSSLIIGRRIGFRGLTGSV